MTHRRVVGHVGEVLPPDLHLVGQAAVGRQLVDQRLLLAGQGHPDHPGAVVLGGVQRERAPAAADVEQPCAGAQPELAAHQLELVVLGVLERVRGVVVGPERTGVRHPAVQEQGVEVVGQVVVVRDGVGVAAPAVQPTAQPGLGGRPARWGTDGARAQRRGQAAADQPGGERATAGIVLQPLPHGSPHQRQGLAEVAFDLEVAAHVRPGEAELAGIPHQVPQRPPGAQHHDRGARPGRRASLGAVPGPYPNRQRDAERLLGQPHQLSRPGVVSAHGSPVKPATAPGASADDPFGGPDCAERLMRVRSGVTPVAPQLLSTEGQPQPAVTASVTREGGRCHQTASRWSAASST